MCGVYVIRGKVHVHMKQGRYLECNIYIRSKDAEKIKHLDKKDVFILVIPE